MPHLLANVYICQCCLFVSGQLVSQISPSNFFGVLQKYLYEDKCIPVRAERMKHLGIGVLK